jgi:hypothetical protein
MCDICHRCQIPCISENLASKTSLTKDPAQVAPNIAGIPQTCDDPEGLPKGHICQLTPINHPCLSGTVALMCPGDSSDMLVSQKIQTHCQICHGVTPEAGDTDSRKGYIEVQLSWGPNVFNGVIDEVTPGIFGYAVHTLNECGGRHGQALATVPAVGLVPGMEYCCNTKMYSSTVLTQLAPGATTTTFGIYPLTSIGAMDVGWVTDPIADVVPTSTTTTLPAVPAKSVADYRSGELPSESINETSVSLVNVEEAEADTGPQPEATDGEGFPVWGIVMLVAVVPALLGGAGYYVARKNQARYKEEVVVDFVDNEGSQQRAPAQPPHLHEAAIHGAAPPDPTSMSPPPPPPQIHPFPPPPEACDDSDSTTRTTAATKAYKSKVAVADSHAPYCE